MTAPAAPTSSTARALIAACLAEPDEDGPRLAYADWLDEQGTERVKCDWCNGSCEDRAPRPVDLPDGRRMVYKGPLGPCPKCHGHSTVADDFHARWAELIRVQCELAVWDHKRENGCNYGKVEHDTVMGHEHQKGHPCPYCNPTSRPIVARESALLLTIRARLMPRCPGYHGDGHGWEDCPLCGKHPNPVYGICPGDIVRGFPRLRIPLDVCGKEEHGKWVVADWLAAARERGATVEVSDREPWHGTPDEKCWVWTDYEGFSHSLPTSLFALIPRTGNYWERNRLFDSRAAAVAALGRAVMGAGGDGRFPPGPHLMNEPQNIDKPAE